MRTKRERPTECAAGRLKAINRRQSVHDNQSAASELVSSDTNVEAWWAQKRPPDVAALDRNPELRISEADVILASASQSSGGDGRTPVSAKRSPVSESGRQCPEAEPEHLSQNTDRNSGAGTGVPECPSLKVSDPLAEDAAVYVDKFGRTHSRAVLQHWSSTALKALGVIPVNSTAEREGARPPSVD
jgi:hypothetical protein